MSKKEYVSPDMCCVRIDSVGFLAASHSTIVSDTTHCENEEDDDDDMITVSVDSLDWHPDTTEKILAAHANCKFMKGEGKEMGKAFGRVLFQAEELIQQNLICCVTSKRVVFIPQDSKRNTQIAIGLVSNVVGLDFFSKKVAKNIFTEGWLNVPLEVKRSQISSCKLSTIPIGNIVIINTLEGPIYLGCDELQDSLDINITIVQPDLFM